MPIVRIRVKPDFFVFSTTYGKDEAVGRLMSEKSSIRDLIEVEIVKPYHCAYCDKDIKEDIKLSDEEVLKRHGLNISYTDKSKSKYALTKKDLKDMKRKLHVCDNNKMNGF